MADPIRIAEDLRGVTSGEVLQEPVHRALYASDGSLYEQTPAVVVRPRLTADIASVLRYAADEGTPVHPRGAGAGFAGGCVGSGIVLDLSRHFRRLVRDDGDRVTVQAGTTVGQLAIRLATSDRFAGRLDAAGDTATLGGEIATATAGRHRPLCGGIADRLVGLSAVLANGETVRLAPGEAAPAELASAISELLRSEGRVIKEHSPAGVANASGYALKQAGESDDPATQLMRLLVASEGTLGVITEATLRVDPMPAARAAALVSFRSTERAAQAATRLLGGQAAACDLIDRRHLGLCRERDAGYGVAFHSDAEAVLLIESVGENAAEAEQRLVAMLDTVNEGDPGLLEVLLADSDEDRRLFTRLATSFLPTLQSLAGRRRAVPGLEAIGLPPAALPQFFRRSQETLKRRQVTASVFAHALQGHVQVWPLLDLRTPGELRRLEALASDLYETVWLLGGTMTCEGGDGLSRTPFTSRQHSTLVNAFREVKRLFDPAGILNPGKVVPTPGARMTHATRVKPLVAPRTLGRAEPGSTPLSTVDLQLQWTREDATAAAAACNGCGDCRREDASTRMCPIFRYTPREEASPRSKANLVRRVLSGELPAETLGSDEARGVADLCVNCHQCRLDCPASVDIPKLMLEAKAAHVAATGMRLDAWWCSRIDALAGWLGGYARVGNALMQRRWFRWVVERITGLSAARRLPAVAERPFLRSGVARKLTKPVSHSGDRVLYFVDTFANRFDVELAEAFVAVLQRHSVAVYTPPQQQHSGMAMISQGGLDAARRIAERNVGLLAEAIRQGHTIVTTEPSAALALTHEYLVLLPDDEDARLVASNTEEACGYLWRRHLNAQLSLELSPLALDVAYHLPCHSRALDAAAPAERLLRLIPDLRVTTLDKGCSGMAGTYGLLRRNYRSSLRAGLPMLNALRSGSASLGATECSTCRLQMEQNASVETIHPVKLLAASYGDLPRLRERLETLAADRPAGASP
ncbi:MAG: FAD-linked oxidase C-terminal domain-containing protein [Planctomycetota bacterium]